KPQSRTAGRLKFAAVVLTILGMALFIYLIYAIGFWEIVNGIERFGWVGFAIILAMYFLRIVVRAFAWTLSVHPPYQLSPRDTIPVVILAVLVALGIVMVIREWHMASWCCDRLYQHGWLKRLLEKGRYDVRRFEDLIYGFYHEYPGRFIPICIFEVLYHAFGVAEVW